VPGDPVQHPPGQGRGDGRVTGNDVHDGDEDLFWRTPFEQDAARPGSQQGEDRTVIGSHHQNHDGGADLRLRTCDLMDQGNALGGRAVDAHHDHVGQHSGCGQGHVAPVGLADVEVASPFQDHPHAQPRDRLWFAQQNSDIRHGDLGSEPREEGQPSAW